MCRFWVFAVVLGTLVLVYVRGADLPATITSGNTISTDETVPSGGTTLDVSTMLLDSSTSTVFRAVRPVFTGTLTITCPTTITAYNKPLFVTVVNGRGQTGTSVSQPLRQDLWCVGWGKSGKHFRRIIHLHQNVYFILRKHCCRPYD